MATFYTESWLNPWAHSYTNDHGICQLQYNSTNKVWIDDARRNDWKRQAKICVDKWKAVKDKNLRVAYKFRDKYLHLFK